MAWTQAQRDKLADAIASGHTQVQFGDRRVAYRSLNEMIATLNMVDRELKGKKRPARVIASFDRGLAK